MKFMIVDNYNDGGHIKTDRLDSNFQSSYQKDLVSYNISDDELKLLVKKSVIHKKSLVDSDGEKFNRTMILISK